MVATVRLVHDATPDFNGKLKDLMDGEIDSVKHSRLLYAQIRAIKQEIRNGLSEAEEAKKRA